MLLGLIDRVPDDLGGDRMDHPIDVHRDDVRRVLRLGKQANRGDQQQNGKDSAHGTPHSPTIAYRWPGRGESGRRPGQGLVSGKIGPMSNGILETAPLDVRPGQEPQFEAAFGEAQKIISAMPGYLSHELLRSVEKPNRYLLLVRWERLEDHVEGFRQSLEYLEWKRLLHHFYDPFPVVEHFANVEGCSATAHAGG